ncbi:MAG: leucine-rich repeat protein [Spirochaetes bacterium]|nr:leucine-rich repeat protein [Brevinematales bacterium]MCL1959493.1 leucine-rich repeat protein [Spirochaetota bacterium]
MSTERMNDEQGTARMDEGTARMEAAKTSTKKTGVVFTSGQTIVLNGKDCVIDKMIRGSSGEAVVYKVIIDGKPYALKHYKPNTPLSDTAKEVITKIKNNPKDRIVKIYDFGSYNDQDFEIMEYAEGDTLDQYLKTNGAIHDTTKIKNIVKMITEGLEQLHGFYKVIYQDLKPENIYFKDDGKTSIVLADFGISSIMKGYDEEVEVTASVTDLYAAPELARKGNNTNVMATPAVDYFALGITMIELWLGEKPFKGVKAGKRDSLINDEEVDLPIDMPDDYAALIKGLIKPKRKDRWGNEQVRKWLIGEALLVESKASVKASTVYDPLKFSANESAESPKELAALMEKYPDIGKTCLYDGIIKEWLKKAGDLMLYNSIQNIMSQYAKDKDAGLYSSVLVLDPEIPFKSKSGKICRTAEDMANAIMAESAYYMEDLKKPNANLYLYLEAAEGAQGKEAADTFCKYFKEYSPKRALALVYLKLQGDDGITIGTKYYQSPDELKKEKDAGQIALIKKAVNEKDSVLLVWLSDIYGDNLKSTDGFNNFSILEQFFLLGLLPFLSYKELGGNSWDALKYFIDFCPGMSDLFETYAAQGLLLTGQNYIDKKTPINYAVCNFNELSRKHGTDTVYNLIRLLHKLGADINEYSGNKTCPLINAYDVENNDLVKLLLELGADKNQYCVYKERIEQQKQKAREEQERKEAEAKREKILKKITGILAAVIAVAAVLFIAYRLTGSLFKFQQNDQGTITVTGYSGKKEVVIPSTEKGTSVTEIGDNAFSGKEITDVTIPDGVTTIGKNTFYDNELTSVVIPDSVTTIGENAFRSNRLTSVTISNSVTSIGRGAFSYNTLTKVTIPNSVTFIGPAAFYRNELTDITIGNNVVSIGDMAFENNSLTNIIISNSVTSIGFSAFADNPITSVRIGANVKLGSNGNTNGILGENTGFNGAYDNNGKRAGTYTRPDENSTTWTRR